MTALPIIPYSIVGGFMGLLLAAAYSDVRRLIIPNQYCIAIALLCPAYGLAVPGSVDWIGAPLVAALMLAIGFFLFCKNVTGGGDVKMIAATALWAGPGLILPFLFCTTLAGGAMAAGMWLRHRLATTGAPLAILTAPTDKTFYDQPMPYGVAIAVGGIYVAFTILGLW